MRKDLKEIQDGTFAKDWVSVYNREGPEVVPKVHGRAGGPPGREGREEAQAHDVAQRHSDLGHSTGEAWSRTGKPTLDSLHIQAVDLVEF